MLLQLTTTHRPATDLGYLLHKHPERVQRFSLPFGADLLSHLYVLALVLDDEKHYWVDEGEIEKLMRRGGDWLPAHPERELIARRYLKHQGRLYHSALASLDETAPPEQDEPREARVSLRDQRLGTVQAVLKSSGARRVLDLGCGPGALLERLARDGHVVLDGGRLVVAHAGMKQAYQGRASGRVRDFALYGETTGETDEYGLPVRGAWAADYRGPAAVVYGHTPVPEPQWLNHTINIDTGCVFGGALTALRWPERELVSVPAQRTHYEPIRPLASPERPAYLLDVEDVAGKRIVQTRLGRQVTVREEHAAGALEVMSRFATDPRWLVYLPPTMAPPATSARPGVLEHPAEVFAEFRAAGVPHVVCEEKHMGSRAIAVVCRDAETARERFGMPEGTGAIYTRTGRPFLDDAEPALARLRAAIGVAGLWDELETGWIVLDCELLPWSAKAMDLIDRQYAAVGAAARASLGAAEQALEQAVARGLDAGELLQRQRTRAGHVERYIEAYSRYVWPVAGLEDLRVAPFHLLAAETGAFADRGHDWHLERADALVQADPDWIRRTERRFVEVTDPAQEAEATAWWEELTGAGGEGMVVKPASFVARGLKGLAQPGIKCRGPEYLRIIYGPEYLDQLDRLRARSLGRKRSLAAREFALGIEALERFVRREPLYRVHECVFAVLALESEPVDPRL